MSIEIIENIKMKNFFVVDISYSPFIVNWNEFQHDQFILYNNDDGGGHFDISLLFFFSLCNLNMISMN